MRLFILVAVIIVFMAWGIVDQCKRQAYVNKAQYYEDKQSEMIDSMVHDTSYDKVDYWWVQELKYYDSLKEVLKQYKAKYHR